jgi:hypothetical protein
MPVSASESAAPQWFSEVERGGRVRADLDGDALVPTRTSSAIVMVRVVPRARLDPAVKLG